MPEISSYDRVAASSNDNVETSETTPLIVHGTDYQANGQSYEPSADRERRASFVEDDAVSSELETPVQTKETKVTWRSLPRKSQLCIVMVASRFLHVVSYVFSSFEEAINLGVLMSYSS